MSSPPLPVVLCFGGHDPSGGAGLVADTQTLTSLGCHPATVVTAVTAQDTREVKQFEVINTELVIAQGRAVLEDMQVAAIKTGMLASPELVTAVAGIADDYPKIPLVVDPVLASGSGQPLSDNPIEDVLRLLLLPRATVVTPNTDEVMRLAPEADTTAACAHALLSTGCQYVYVTGTHTRTEKVINRLYGDNRELEQLDCERLPGSFHGSGCTLASALAAYLAHGLDVPGAVRKAQDFTWRSLVNALQPGHGQALPDRMHWCRDLRNRGNG
jgi:hydroxymethylpyrimidine/phosphomethylpyrimidine kinase